MPRFKLLPVANNDKLGKQAA